MSGHMTRLAPTQTVKNPATTVSVTVNDDGQEPHSFLLEVCRSGQGGPSCSTSVIGDGWLDHTTGQAHYHVK